MPYVGIRVPFGTQPVSVLDHDLSSQPKAVLNWPAQPQLCPASTHCDHVSLSSLSRTWPSWCSSHFSCPLCKTSIERFFLRCPGSVKRTYKYPGTLWLCDYASTTPQSDQTRWKKIRNSCNLCSHTKAVQLGCVGDPDTTTPTNVTFDCQTNTEQREYSVSTPSSYRLNDRMISPTIFHLTQLWLIKTYWLLAWLTTAIAKV